MFYYNNPLLNFSRYLSLRQFVIVDMYNFTNYMYSGWLRNVPEISQKHHVIRKDLLEKIRDQLLMLNEDLSGQILVHGLPGSGKTVAVSQAVQQIVLQDACFHRYGVYWIKIGTFPIIEIMQ